MTTIRFIFANLSKEERQSPIEQIVARVEYQEKGQIGLNVTKNAVSGDFFARNVFRFSQLISRSERKTNLHRGGGGAPFGGMDPPHR
jgi:hypothetical protein